MEHYICLGGCRGESEEPGACQDINCQHHEKSLSSCDCDNGHHDGAFDEKEDLVATKIEE